MNLVVHSQFIIHNSQLILSGSKSETNRLLLLQALYPNLILENTSNADDSEVMVKALTTINHQPPTINHQPSTKLTFTTQAPPCDF